VIIQWKKYIFTINDIYGSYREENIPKADVNCYFQQSDYIGADKRLTLHKKVKNLCVDLYKPVEQLRKELNKDTRYQINRAGKDDLRIRHLIAPTIGDIQEFKELFNQFAREKGIELCRENKVKALQKSGRLAISYVYNKDGRKLAGHLCIIDGIRATGLYSYSSRFTESGIPPRNIGRANRYLHWHEILFFKKLGYEVLDFLGLSLNEEDTGQQNLNKFKKSFGGREDIQYQSFVPQTKKGLLIMLLLRMKWRNQQELVLVNGKPVRREGRSGACSSKSEDGA